MNEHKTFKVISPIDGSIYLERTYAQDKQIEAALSLADKSQKVWRNTSIQARAEICLAAVDFLVDHADELGEEITMQMGRPIRYTPFEIKGGLKERAEYMISSASSSLCNIDIDNNRYISKVPHGTVLVLAPWNYPYLTSVNAIIPAIMAGNSVILKHSDQTPLTAERYQQAFDEAGLPESVFQFLHLTHDQVANVLQDHRINYVAFTGSVAGGQAVQKAVSDRFIGSGFELGGKDAAYVRADADLKHSVENLVDGAFFNSGQSCCGIERIYVHEHIYEEFLREYVTLTRKYVVGNPMEVETQIGPMVSKLAAERLRETVQEAEDQGAVRHIRKEDLNHDAYFFPEVLTNLDNGQSFMQEETFGPVVGIMKVKDDEEAIRLMNDSQYGLTGSIWTKDLEMAANLGSLLHVGTVFANRCDYLDPALPWSGVKNSGRGMTLSSLGYDALTRTQSFHLRPL